MNTIDLIILIVLAITIYTEVKRSYLLSLFDIVRVVIALILGGFGYWFGAILFNNLDIGIFLFLLFAFGSVLLLPKLFKIVPKQAESIFGRIIGGMIGFVLGTFICLGVILIVATVPSLRDDVDSSTLSQPILSLIPAIHYEADVLNLKMPSMGTTALKFDEEGNPVFSQTLLKQRVNFRRLEQSTCIECGAEVNFEGYKRRGGLLVSPLFVCPNCGRRSDGCQTYEGFHRIYGHCPIEIAEDSRLLDCGVWSNNRPVLPKGKCPVCGKSIDESKFRIRFYDD
ncbi:MAG: CvpA family protein [bacterium]